MLKEIFLGFKLAAYGAVFTVKNRWVRLLASAVGLAVAVCALMGVGLAASAAMRAFAVSISGTPLQAGALLVTKVNADSAEKAFSAFSREDFLTLQNYGTITPRAEFPVIIQSDDDSITNALELPVYITDLSAFRPQAPDQIFATASVAKALPRTFMAAPKLQINGDLVIFSNVAIPQSDSSLPFALFIDLAHPNLAHLKFDTIMLIPFKSYQAQNSASLTENLAQLGFKVNSEALNSDSPDSTPMLLAFSLNITVMAVLTAVVALALLLISSMRMAQDRNHEALILRALGATPALIAALLLAEAFVCGIFGAILAMTLGRVAVLAAAESILGTASALFLGGQRGVIPDFYSPFVIAIVFSLAVILSLLGAAIPALKLALQKKKISQTSQKLRWLRFLPFATLALFLSIGVTWCAALVFSSRELALVCAILVIIATGTSAAAAVFIAAKIVTSLGLRFKNSKLMVGAGLLSKGANTLARGAAVGAVSIVLIVALSAMVQSFRGSLESWAKENVSADVIVRALQRGAASVTPTLSSEVLAALSALRSVHCMEQFSSAVTFNGVKFVGVSPRCASSNPVVGRVPKTGNEVLVNEAAVKLSGLKVGSKIASLQQSSELTVVGVIRDFSPQGAQVFIAMDQFFAITKSAPRVAAVAIYGKPQASVSIQEVNAALRGRGIASSGQNLRVLMLATFDDTFLITRFMRLCVGCLALVGLAVLYGQWLGETANERGTFVLLGASLFERVTAVAIGTSCFALIVILLGLGGGYLAALVLTNLVNPLSFGWSFPLVFPAAEFLSAIALMIFIALILGTLGRKAELPTQRPEETLG